ncbi:DUF262 domain-containing protein [Pectobacterium parmentieri]|uniref:DUF262 domain-containing protein n=1 Tax=Pectobacterium parmentieri TaxID=1905730 RepID=A0ABS0S7I0_PECPM|nr:MULTISPECIES: DUF262 domain-containing protein [Pectobacterium]MBI0557296.1 DUF262 domain-containing protein [Pectobacterium parmentieri]MBL0866630.1 DUF262 domain-containing protein [Pectobacterium carotovorum]MBL0909962.1 DUF262 domain-containing protein [Pectobacterium carotovorum]MBN3193183.1 DUF262 domain-containing protein [Pectobacterium versatile]QRN37003.1 DUF262 domain-containing protein [Pectobacterium carotovorum]
MVDKIKLEEQIYNKRRDVKYDMRDLTVEYLTDKYKAGITYSEVDDEDRNEIKVNRNVLYIPEYQREFTWDEKRSSKLIESILLGLPIPFIFVAENKDGAWEIVDGSQRIRCLDMFVSGGLKLTGLQSLTRANGLRINDFDTSRIGKLLDTALRVIVLSEETTEDVKKDMFERINRGSDLLKAMEKRKGIYTGEFTKFIYDYVKSNVKFNSLLKIDKWQDNRQEREELLLRFFALSEDNNYKKGVSGSISDFLDRFLEKKNAELISLTPSERKNILDGYENKINKVVDFVDEYFPYGFRHRDTPQTKRSVFEAISVGVNAAIENGCIDYSLINKNMLANALISADLHKYTHSANQSHKKEKLSGRVDYIERKLRGI